MPTDSAVSSISSTDTLVTLVGLLVALSVASERLVEIIKGLVPALDKENADTMKEGWRKAGIHTLAIASGVLTALLARPALHGVLPDPWSTTGSYVALGFLTSGGSGLWNGILGYVKNVKDIKKSEALRVRTT